jgi:hypothetical protein
VNSLLTKLRTDATPTSAELRDARPLFGLSEAHNFELVALVASEADEFPPGPPAGRAGDQAAIFCRWPAALTFELDGVATITALTAASAKALHARWKRAAATHASKLNKLRDWRRMARARGQGSVAAQAEQEIEAA